MNKIWNLTQHQDKLALLDEYGKSMTYAQLCSEASMLAEKIGHRCLVFSLSRKEIGSVID